MHALNFFDKIKHSIHAYTGLMKIVSLLAAITVFATCSRQVIKSGKFWSKSYPGLGNITVQDIILSGSNYVVAGYGFNAENNEDVSIAMFDGNGDTVWKKFIGSRKYERANTIVSNEKGFVAAGVIDSKKDGNRDMWVMQLDREGDVIWNRVIGGYKDDYANSIKKDGDRYIIIGSSSSFGKGSQCIWVILLDSNGRILWDKKISEGVHDSGIDGIVVNDGYIITGNSMGEDTSSIKIFKLDKNGNMMWEKLLGNEGYDYVESIANAADGYMLSGSTHVNGESVRDALVIMLDLKGSPKWSKTYGGKGDDWALSVIVSNDGFVISGTTNSYSRDNSYKAWAFEVDRKGHLLWNRTFQDAYTARRVAPVKDGYVIAGNRNVSGSGRSIWIMKTDKNGDMVKPE